MPLEELGRPAPRSSGRHRSTSALARLGRRHAGQPLAHDQRERILERRIGALGDLGIAAVRVLVLDARREIGGHAGHAVGAERLDARPLDGLEHGARRAGARAPAGCAACTSWQAAVSARLSAQPRMTAISRCEGTRDGSGSCTCLPSISGLPGAKPTWTSASPAMARTAQAERPLERLGRRFLAFGSRMRHAAQLSATLAALSGSSSPKQR